MLIWIFLSLFSQLVSCLVFNSTALVLATYDNDGSQSSYIFAAYGIWSETVILDKNGTTQLPQLENSVGGNYGLLVVINEASSYGNNLLTEDQWNTLYAYQEKYGVRMVQAESDPSDNFGVTALSSCCSGNEEQYLTTIEDVASSEFPSVGVR